MSDRIRIQLNPTGLGQKTGGGGSAETADEVAWEIETK